MLNRYFSKDICKIFINIYFLYFSFNINHAKNISAGIEGQYVFSTIKQIFDKNTFYGGKFKKELFFTIPLTYKLITNHPVTKDGYNYKHNLQWSLILWMKKDYLINLVVSNYLEEKNKSSIDLKKIISITNQKIISSWWININILNNILENKENETDCFCYGLGINYSKMSIFYRERGEVNKNVDKNNEKGNGRMLFYHHIWCNFSILGKCTFAKYFSIATTISMVFLIIMIKKIGDDEEINIETDGSIIGYDLLSRRRFTLLNSLPILNVTFYLDL